MTDIDAIFAADRQHPPHERSLPWPETRGGLTVVVEPKPHWAGDMRAFDPMLGNIAPMPTGPRTALARGSSAMSIPAAMT